MNILTPAIQDVRTALTMTTPYQGCTYLAFADYAVSIPAHSHLHAAGFISTDSAIMSSLRRDDNKSL